MNILTEFPQLYICSMYQSIKKNPAGICVGSYWVDKYRRYRLSNVQTRIDPLLYRMLGFSLGPDLITYRTYAINVGKKFNIDPDEFDIIQRQSSGREAVATTIPHQRDLIDFGEYVRRCAQLSGLMRSGPLSIRTQRTFVEAAYNSCKLAKQFPHAHSKLMEILDVPARY